MIVWGNMNVFRFVGDMSHVFSIIVLLLRLCVVKNANGISLKTQELFLIVFVSRYIDLFTHFYSYYNTFMKIAYICSTATIVYMIRKTEPLKSTYDKTQDSFKHLEFAVAPSFGLACVWWFLFGTRFDIIRFDIMEILWGFSIILESIAIIPQLITLQRYREVENLTSEVTEPPPEVYLTVIATGKTPDFDDDNTAVVDADDNGPPCCGSIDLEISDDENPNPNPKPKPNPSHQRNLFGPHRFDIMEIVWDFFIILVSIKIIPQLITLKRYREVENLMSDYIFFFGLYRGMYLLNWIYRSYYEHGYQHHWIMYIFGTLQTALCVDFFCCSFVFKKKHIKP